jgi:hypothetical protein
MKLQRISFIPNGRRHILVMFVIAGSFIFPQVSQLAYAHTFSTSESAEFLSLVDQIKAEVALVNMNLQTSNNNATALAQAHAQKAATLLLVDNNDTLGEIREVNNRIANSLENGLKQLEGNATVLTSSTSSRQMPSQERIQSINQTVQSLVDILSEAVSVRIEQAEQNNSTTWAMSLAHLVNVVLGNYGNATGASFDLTDISNMPSMGGTAGGMQMNDNNNSSNNNNTMTMSGSQMQMSNNSNSTSDNNTMTMMMTKNNTAGSTNSSSMSNTTTTTTTIVDTAAYQSAQYLANNTILQLFNDKLKPLSINSNGTSANNNTNTTTASMIDQGQNNNASLNVSNNDNTVSNIDKIQAGLLQLRDDINHKATPQEVMITAHTNIHPVIMRVYGLTLEQEEEGHADHDES